MKYLLSIVILSVCSLSWAQDNDYVSNRQFSDLVRIMQRIEKDQAQIKAQLSEITDLKLRLKYYEERDSRIGVKPVTSKPTQSDIITGIPPRPADLYGNDGKENGEWTVDPQNGIPVIAEHVWAYSQVGGAGIWQRVRSHGKPIPVNVWYGGDRAREDTIRSQRPSNSSGGGQSQE